MSISDQVSNHQMFSEMIEEWIPMVVKFGMHLVIAVVIFVVGSKIIKLFCKGLERSFLRMDMEVSVRKFLISVINASMYCILVFVIAGQIGVDSASIIALLGSASIAVGLAVQGSLANFAGGVLILLMKPFHVGDYIITKDGEGTVITIGLVYTILITGDNKQIVIPNGGLANSALTNVTAREKRRIEIFIKVGYSADLNMVKKIIQKVFENHPKILKEDSMEVFVSSLEDGAVVIGGRAWTMTNDYWSCKCSIMETVKYELEKEKVDLPVNYMEVHIR